MARELTAHTGDEFRVICPSCETMWTTLALPAECPECAAVVTIHVIKAAPLAETR